MKLLAVFASLMFASCESESTEQARWYQIRKASDDSGICLLHHVPLQRTVVYQWSHFDTTIIDPDEADFRAQRKYPNSLSYIYRRMPSADFHDKKIEVYCPVCQQRFEQETHQVLR